MTSNEIAPVTEVEIIPAGASLAATTGSEGAISQLRQHAEAMNIAYELAEKMCGTALVPQIYRGKPEDGTAAILYGAELGLNPIQSLQQIFVVHGTPSIYARTMVALVKVKGYLIETVESTNEQVTVRGTNPRTGVFEESTWTIDRAAQAGYVPTVDEKTGKFATNANGKLIGNEKYLKDPQAMLYAKAAAEVCRKIAPEVLLGISRTREELELEQPIRATVERVAPPQRGVAGLGAALGISAPAEPEPAPIVLATSADLRKLAAALDKAGITDVEEAAAFLRGRVGRELASSKEMTRDEIAATIRFLETGEEPADAQAAQQ